MFTGLAIQAAMMTEHILDERHVLIIGSGPVGMVTATVLAYHGVKSTILEKHSTTTRYDLRITNSGVSNTEDRPRWPKMDLTNVRSMELFRKIGLADELRRQGVPSDIPYNVIFSTGLSQSAAITQWDHVSVDKYRQRIASANDGSQPREPYQRISQAVFEAWMKVLCDENSLIDVRFGWKLQDIKETPEGIEALVTESHSNTNHVWRSRYLVACDGASSTARQALNIPMEGTTLPVVFLLVHFKSRDLARLHRQGRFWHLFILEDNKFGGAVISQDGKDTFTIHYPLPPGLDGESIGSEEAVYAVLGGQHGPFEIAIDEILVRSLYQPSICVARAFAGPQSRVFLAGDAAHTNIPTGGYGMNTGIGDAFDIGWKLAAVVNGHGRGGLLQSYEEERKPVAQTNVERSGVHMSAHMQAVSILGAGGVAELAAGSDRGNQIKKEIHRHYQIHNGENTDLGIEMGYRYTSRCIVRDDGNEVAQIATPHTYIPTTTPGSRPPHVFLRDGSSIFDHFGKDFTLMEFHTAETEELGSSFVTEAAGAIGMPLTHVRLTGEVHAAQLWERSLILVRPDHHVAWRGRRVASLPEALDFLKLVLGHGTKLREEFPGINKRI